MALEDVIWLSRLTREDVADLNDLEVDELMNQLDYVVMSVCQDWGLFQ